MNGQLSNNAIEIVPEGAGRYSLRGTLTFDTVPRAWAMASDLWSSGEPLNINLAGVTRTDSAGLALLIEWMRGARSRNREIQFRNVPAQLLAIARATRLDAILPLA